MLPARRARIAIFILASVDILFKLKYRMESELLMGIMISK